MENYVAFTCSIDLRSIYQVFFKVSSIITLVAKATLFWRCVVFNVVEEFFFVEVARLEKRSKWQVYRAIND